jgi:hypothetical protein
MLIPTVSGLQQFPCVNSSLGGSILVNANSTIAGTTNQTPCINNAITNITYNIGGGATSATVTGLPTGVTGVYNAGVVTISGTPTVSGNFSYTVTTVGPCINPSLGGTINVGANSTITLTSAAATTNQTRCINNAITNITYSIAGGATSATVTGLPTGVTGVYSAGVFTISGTPTVSGTFNYTVTTVGPCVNNSLGGSILVNANSTIALSSAAGTTSQTPCINNAITDITYTIGGGATSATVTGLPAGVTGVYNAGVFTISGTPTVSGNFSYTVTTVGPCINPSLGGTINVRANSTIALTSAAATANLGACVNSAITNVVYTIAGGGTGATITAGSLPAGLTGVYNAGVFTISGTPTVTGTFNYTVTTAGPCINNSLSGSIVVSPAAVGGALTIAGTNPLSNLITSCPFTSGTINLGGQTGTITQWEFSTNGGTTWTPVTNNTTTLNYTNLTTTTIYRAVITSGTCAPIYSAAAIVSVVPPSIPSPVVATPSAICVGDTSTITAGTGFNQWSTAVDGEFNQANPPGWQVTENGTQINFPANANNGSTNPWSETNGPKVLNGITYDNGAGNGKFAVASGVVSTQLETQVFSTIGMTTAILTYNQAFNLNAGTTAAIEISLNGGATYSATPVMSWTGAQNFANPNNGWLPVNIDLSSYLGQNNVRLRFNFNGVAGGQLSNWAIDGLSIPGNLPPVTYNWSPSTGIIGAGNTSPVRVAPTTTTSYTIISTVGGCPGGSANVTVTVYPLPAITPAPAATPVCASPNAQTTTLTYSGANNPNQYSITWNASPVNAFVPRTDVALSAGTITINVPANTAPGTYTGNISVSNANGCRSIPSSFTVTVNPRPTAAFAAGPVICQGQTATITLNVTGSGTISGTLNNGTTFSGTAPTVTVNVSPAVTTTYSIASLTNGTCGAIAADYAGTVTVTVNTPPAIASNPNGSSICLGSPASFTAAASGTGVNYQWELSTDNGSTWNSIANGGIYSGATSATLTITVPTLAMVDYLYRVKANAGNPCNSFATSTSHKIKFINVWLGTNTTNWQTGSNWSDGNVPSLACTDVHILNRSNQPTLNSGSSTIRNLIIYSGAYLTLSNQASTTLQIAGTITNSGTFNALDGKLELNGGTAQSIAGSVFYQRTLNSLTLSNPGWCKPYGW